MSGPSADPSERTEPALACARTVVGALLAEGVTDAVLCPGSRSAPFAYVLAASDAAGLLRLHVRVDERTAGFLALGLAKASNRPVPVVTTSGTAAANLHPAVLEADAAGVPLIAITADRPAALRHAAANQTADQLQLFGGAVRGFAAMDDGWEQRAWVAETRRLSVRASGVRTRHPGPVQLNVSLSDPLQPSDSAAPIVPSARRTDAARPAEPRRLRSGPRTIVVAGDTRPAVGRQLAAQCAAARLPLIAEPSSNARRGLSALATGRVLLGDRELAEAIERVIVVGRPTLSRSVSRLLNRPELTTYVVSDRADWPDPGLVSPQVVDAIELEPDDSDWLDRWQLADGRVRHGIDALLADNAAPLGRSGPAMTGVELARTLAAAIPPDTPLVVGSSNAIRDLDLAPIRDDLGDVYANRGLAGIDGTVSTAVGVALATGAATHALVGDLTFLHDLTGLLLGPQEPRPDLRIVVADDGGGAIFSTLEHGRPEYADVHERVFATPHRAELTTIADGLGVAARSVRSAAELRAALAEPPRGIEVVVATVDRGGRRELDASITALGATP